MGSPRFDNFVFMSHFSETIGKLKHAAIHILLAVVFLMLLYIILQIFAIASFSVPSDSMSPTIKPGDRIFVPKITTGARIFDIRKAVGGESVEINRLPGWETFKRGDILVFNFPHTDSWNRIALNWQRYYVKRGIGIPGDTVEIRDFRYHVNSRLMPGDYAPAEVFRQLYPDDSTARAVNLRGYMVDVSDTIDRWTIRDFGPLVVPKKGLTMTISGKNAHRYRQIIEWETGDVVTVTDNSLQIGDSVIEEYTFKENYYFMGGDNNVSSMDSRYWGLVPEKFIVGKATFIWWSENRNGIQWDRILKRIK